MLDSNALARELALIFSDVENTSADAKAKAIASAIDKFVRGAEVTVTAITGEIAVEGTPAAQANVVPITLKGGDVLHPGGLR